MEHEIDQILRDWLPPEGDVLYCPNPGNAGDALIVSATWQCFDRLGLRPRVTKPNLGLRSRVTKPKRFPKQAHIILAGGGNLVPPYRDISRVLEACLEWDVGSCLLLPHTIRNNEALLGRLDGRFTLLCRDLQSLDHVRQHAPLARSLFVDDMALGLEVEVLLERSRSLQHRLSLLLDRQWMKRRRKWKHGLAQHQPDAEGRLEILRSDVEAKSTTPRLRETDLMQFYRSGHENRPGCDQVSADIIKLLGGAKRVLTDRLHVALPATLLGLQVEIMDNNYGKLSAVWKSSLEGRYPNAKLV